MINYERLPVIPQPNSQRTPPWTLRRELVGNDAYFEVRTVPHGTAPLALIKDGPTNLDMVKTGLDPEAQENLNDWIVLGNLTQQLNEDGYNVTVYGGGGSMLLEGVTIVRELETEDGFKRVNQTIEEFAQKGKQFVEIILQSR